ncbi:MAG: substrate-binding domain-containing protein [Anaerolineae bacterium]|nr:substrate-binding domain-containing protein [Anaerolineae bacterium]
MSTGKKWHADPGARRLTLVYLAPSIASSIGQARWLGVMDVAREQGANLLCLPGSYWGDPGPGGPRNVLYDLLDRDLVDGVVLGNIVREDFAGRGDFHAYYDRHLGLPAVSLRQMLEGIPAASQDDYQGMADAIAHLVDVHHLRRIAFLRGPEGHPSAEKRYQAYVDVLMARGLPLNPALILPPVDWNGLALDVLLDERGLTAPADFEAIVAVNDRMALRVIDAYQARGLLVPRDVAVVGFNDDLEGRASTPPLTTVALPFYEQGRQATEMLLAMLRGEQVPEHLFLPSQLLVRQSCGCMSPNVVAAGKVPAGTGNALSERRAQIVAAMAAAVGADVNACGGGEHLIDLLVADASGASDGAFLPALNECLRLAIGGGHEVMDWQGLISVLRYHLLDQLPAGEVAARAESVWQQARVLIGEAAERARVQQALRAERRAEVMQAIGQALISSFDVENLTGALIDGLPSLGIGRCYLSLYEDRGAPTEQARLVLAWDERGRTELDVEHSRFPPRRLLPDGVLPEEDPFSLVVEPLYFGQDQLGLVLFDAGVRDGSVYEALRSQISSALQGALLLQERHQAEQDLQRRALELQTAAEVSHAASSILDPRQLIQQVVDLIRDRFGLYYVGLFLLDEIDGATAAQGEWASLRAGTGSAGQEMLRRRHRLQVGGKSMVGQCIATGEPRVAPDVSLEEAHFANTLLPDTRSELALPLVSHGRSIGALTIQSAVAMAFRQEDVSIFQTMANQLANSIENAFLLDQTQQAMEELKAIQRRYVRDGWSRYLDQTH